MNKIRSIQLKITLMTGLFLIIAVASLVYYSATTLREESALLAKTEAIGLARQKASSVQVIIEVALDAARTTAQVLNVVPENRKSDLLSRDVVNKILISVLQKNPDFLGTYTLWEPNAFDQKDQEFSKTTGHDESGRFIPYWTSGASGAVVEALAGYEDTTRDELGGRAGDYYLIPRETQNEAIIDPYVYAVQGKDTLLTSLVVPVVHQNQFYGIAGVDISLAFLQKIADDLDLYDRTGKMLLLSHKGIISGLTGHPELVGKHIKEFEKHPEDQKRIFDAIKNKQELTFFDDQEGLLKVQVPINIGSTSTNWAIIMQIPEDKIYEAANAQMLTQIGIGVALILAGIIILWWISRTIAQPLRNTSRILTQIADQGDFSKRVEVSQLDETGQMGNAINILMDALQAAIGELNTVMEAVSKRDLMKRVSSEQKGDLNQLNQTTNQSIDLLMEALSQVNSTTQQVNSGANELAASAQALASGTSEQAASLEEVSSSMAEVASQTKANNENAAQASQLTDQTMEVVEKGNQQMQDMLKSMDEISNSSTNISKIIKTIDEIAFQTNLLALNAAVEAARAGKYGKGFAVVAEEVRNLAARSAEAAKNTTELIENSAKEVENGVESASKTAEILTDINNSVTKVNDIVAEIASGSIEQQKGIEEINKGLNQVNDVVQQNSSISEETAASSEELSGQSAMMQQLVGRFKLAQTTTQDPLPIRQSPPADKVGTNPKMITLDDDNFGKY
ncbi:MAG: HAMP domain-containing protein [Deltaproteobacteria bacterium]|jgi:methyl-accepting chemotaxis protein|nr:HAMP domain-containing protein [Deltaproteobacteria bacterium]MBT4263085.1 HAMP domain-containing protein [Deltaproteobacteria bacterium]MBT4643436.1 HAMP domain-containing protein [Deltaproteobacteria bacterium]MBT6502485.1 HAMP domain-containing protein [Deltaproteobacteria bacterium]MBT6614661.1 HAMP domain-containing protein [Deltaproteobacteria bacterium]